MTEQNMAGRLARIMGDVGRVEKKGKITSQGSGPTYKFARDADVLEKVGPLLADAGIVMVPEHTELLSMGLNMRETQLIANIKTSWHVTDGKESIRFETLGQGQDSGDKALPKAQSNARKYAFFMLFHIVTGDDPDQHVSEYQPERGEQVAAAGRRAGAPPAAPSPAQYRRGELAELLREKNMHIAQLERFADLVGIPKGSRATNIQMDDLIDAVRGHGITQPEPVRAHAGSGVGPATVGRGGDGSSDLPAALDTPHAAGTAAATVSAELGTQPAPAPSMDDILAVSGGVDVTPGVVWTTTLTETDSTTNVAPPPPKPGTPEYVALPAPAKASARAYWQRQAEPTPEPSEQMRAALVQS